jgi:hypothetical protein
MLESNATQTKMDCPTESKNDSCDEPLFVLKYRRREVVKRLIYYILPFAVLGNGIFHWWPPQGLGELLLEVMGAIALFICGAFFTDILFFREVRLYKDKFVKIWQFIGTMQIELVNAQLRCVAGPTISAGPFSAGPLNKYMRVFDRQTNVALSYIKAVCYDEKLADQDDVKKLNTLLADLTGRKVEEFEQPRIKIARLIEQEKK